MATIYRGYDIEREPPHRPGLSDTWVVRQGVDTVHIAASEQAAMDWVDAQKKRRGAALDE